MIDPFLVANVPSDRPRIARCWGTHNGQNPSVQAGAGVPATYAFTA
jgi:hypothetical protein